MKKNKVFQNLIVFLSFFSPCVLRAQRTGNFSFFEDVLEGISTVLGSLIPVLIGIALLVFIWGLVLFIGKSGDDKSHEEGRKRMVWGIVALFVMVSVWGIVALLGTLLGIGGTDSMDPPDVLN